MRKLINTSSNALVLLSAPREDGTVRTFAKSGNSPIFNILNDPSHHSTVSIKFKTFQATVLLLLPKNLDRDHFWVSLHKGTNPFVFAHLQQNQLVLTRPSKKAVSFLRHSVHVLTRPSKRAVSFLRLHSVHVLTQTHTPDEIFHYLAFSLLVRLIDNLLSSQAQSFEPQLILRECPSLVTEKILDLSKVFM